MEPLSTIKALITPALKLYQMLLSPKGDVPILVQDQEKGIDAGTPKWARGRDWTSGTAPPAECTFFLTCKGGGARFAEVISRDLKMTISPNSFATGDKVALTCNLDTYDNLVTFPKKCLSVNIKVITETGRKATTRYKCVGYRIEPCL